MTTAIIVSAVLIAVLLLIWTSGDSTNEKDAQRLRQDYESALTGLDKKAALKAGRLYYSIVRKNKALTIYDEQAIANDLSTMPQEVYFPKTEKNESTDIEIVRPSTSTIINY